MSFIFSGDAERDFRTLRSQGVTLPSNPVRGRLQASQMGSRVRGRTISQDVEPMARRMGPSQGRRSIERFSSNYNVLDRSGSEASQKDVSDMIRRRGRYGSMDGMAGGSGATGSAVWAWPKMRDPWEYWKERVWWFRGDEESEDGDKELEHIRDWCRLMYTTHSLVPSLIDIYSRFPLLDIEFQHKDEKLKQFYEDLFFDELNYQDHLFDMSREHWTTGEVFSLASWHDGIGAWEDDEIINPNDVVVTKNRALRSYGYHIKVPEEIKKLLETQQPREEYLTLMRLYPDVVQWARQEKEIPVSDILMKQIKFKVNPWSNHGTPILLRAFRQLMLEESLNSSQDAVADRLYSPLILANLGLDNVDEEGPWIPDPGELEALRDDLHIAINSDFRLIVYHHGLDIKSVFGRESMPRLDGDFDRVEGKILQVFGIGQELLSGGASGVPYAAGALNRELITQMLETYQVNVERFLRERMEPVAERQGHYEYDKRGDLRIPQMETVLMIDEETGEEYIEERPKLAIPEVKFRTMNLRDETTEREFLQQLADNGFPISLESFAMNIPVDFEEELEKKQTEKIEMVIKEQEFKVKLFQRLEGEGLPIPADLQQDYQIWMQQQQGQPVDPNSIDPSQIGQPAEDISTPPVAPNMMTMPAGGGGGSSGGGGEEGGQTAPPQRPAISDEQRATMPTAASKISKNGHIKDSALDESDVREQERAVYGNRMRFGTPHEMRQRRKMRLPLGMKITDPSDIEHFLEDEDPDDQLELGLEE